MTDPLSPVTSPARAPAERETPEKVRGAAQQFEALLIAEMLKTMRSDGGWLGTGEDQAGESAMELAEEQFSSAVASRGGFGLTGMITGALAPTTPKSE